MSHSAAPCGGAPTLGTWPTSGRLSGWGGSTTCTSACRIGRRPPGGTRSTSGSSRSTRTTSGRPGSRADRSRSRPTAVGRCWRCSRPARATRWFRSRPASRSASTPTPSCRSPARCPAGSTTRAASVSCSTDLVDFDLCWAFDLVDPWGNQYELNCYDYDRVRAELVEADARGGRPLLATRGLRGIPRLRVDVVAPSAAGFTEPSCRRTRGGPSVVDTRLTAPPG